MLLVSLKDMWTEATKYASLMTIMACKLLENKLVSEIASRGFKAGLAKIQETSNKYKLGANAYD